MLPLHCLDQTSLRLDELPNDGREIQTPQFQWTIVDILLKTSFVGGSMLFTKPKTKRINDCSIWGSGAESGQIFYG
jgi:hypothetical protein